MTYGQAVQDPTTRLGAAFQQSKAEREQAIAALMAQGMTLEQAAQAWAESLFRQMSGDLARVKRATRKRENAEREWRDAIRAAASTNSLRAVGEAAKITHVRVLQITRE